MAMNAQKIQQYGDELYESLVSRVPVEPLTNREADISIDDAYQIQLRMIERQLQTGQTVVGKKIGVTSKIVMDMLGVNQPDFGHLLSGMVFNEGEAVDTSKMIAPKAEAAAPPPPPPPIAVGEVEAEVSLSVQFELAP